MTRLPFTASLLQSFPLSWAAFLYAARRFVSVLMG
jgi:hypothetical protein